MASKKVNDQILLFEAANFKGTPKQFGTLASKLKESFPNFDGKIGGLIDKAPLMKNHVPNHVYHGMDFSNFDTCSEY
jgi:hypothetical protein